MSSAPHPVFGIAAHVQVGEQPCILKYISHAALVCRHEDIRLAVLPEFIAYPQCVAHGRCQPCNSMQQSGFSAARWSDQRGHAVCRCPERGIELEIATAHYEACVGIAYVPRARRRRLATWTMKSTANEDASNTADSRCARWYSSAST